MAATAKTFKWGKAPKEIQLKGDPEKAIESAEHIISFPGGSIAVCRTSDNKYWVHIAVTKEQNSDVYDQSKMGEIVDGRMDRLYPNGTEGIELPSDCYHLAFLIDTIKP